MTLRKHLLGFATMLVAASAVQATICIVPDNGSGTANLPPNCFGGGGYLSPDDVHKIISGLPPGTTIEVGPEHFEFSVTNSGPGGSLGGEFEQFNSFLQLHLVGTGTLAGWTRNIGMGAQCETHLAPRMLGDPVQSFDTTFWALQGQIVGDPDFDLLRITAGDAFGMPSPGHTTLTQQPGGNWAVDSFFDITYRIDFVGSPGGVLAGMSGSTTATIRMQVGDPVCGPDATGDHCTPATCPDPNARCSARCVNYNPVTQNTTVLDCECRLPDECQVDLVTPVVGTGLRNDPCVVADNGGGTVSLPPQGCEYLSPDEVHQIIDGLPAGTTIEFAPIHKDFICERQSGTPGVCSFMPPPGLCEDPLDLTQDCFDSTLAMQLNGTGTLLGFHRNLSVPVGCEVHSQPRVPGQPVQSFDTDMFRLFGQLPPGDPDFDLLRITGGTNFGLPSPGHTTLTQMPGGNWAVDSFFDITYRIDFIGAPGGPLAGMSGSTTATIRMQAGFANPPSCAGQCPPGAVCNETITPKADGSYDLCCDCVTEPPQACCFPNGTCANLPPSFCDGFAGGAGSVCLGDADGDGIDDACDCGPVNGVCGGVCPTPTAQDCLTRCVDFDPSTGQVTATECACTNPNECHVGVGTGAAGKSLRANPCDVPDNGGGTVTLPPAGCEYLSPDDVHRILDGLPAGTTIEFATIHKDFICKQDGNPAAVCSFPPPIPGVDCDEPGGSLGGEKECSDSNLAMNLTGTGTLAGWNRPVTVPISFETHVAPRTPGDPVQSFDTDMFRLFGQITGDPDFDLLRIVGGTDFGLPSPGHTTLTQQPGGTWAVDSFFDITYRIDFVGAPGGPLAGMSGSTTGTIRMATGFTPPPCVGGCPGGGECFRTVTVDPASGTAHICCECVMQEQLDYGDAPDPTYPTLLLSNGARHVIVPTVFLGLSIDPEADGQPTANADGDDLAALDDEDGVTFLTLLKQGQAATVQVVASVGGSLTAWVDFNANGSWADAGEQVFAGVPLVAGANVLSFPVPTTATLGRTYARFRFTTAAIVLPFDGLVSDGEVEDYLVQISDGVPPVILDSWVSRLEHQVGTFFEIGLTQAGGAGKPLGSTTIPSRNCERRIRGATVGYKLRCTFSEAVLVPAGSVTATPGVKVAAIANVGGNTWEFTFAGANVLTNIAKNTITVSPAVTDLAGNALGGDPDVDLYLLQGNVGNAADPAGLLQVNTTDKSQLILRIGQMANLTNFWFDISNVGPLGNIDTTDKSQLILRIGNQVVWP